MTGAPRWDRRRDCDRDAIRILPATCRAAFKFGAGAPIPSTNRKRPVPHGLSQRDGLVSGACTTHQE